MNLLLDMTKEKSFDELKQDIEQLKSYIFVRNEQIVLSKQEKTIISKIEEEIKDKIKYFELM